MLALSICRALLPGVPLFLPFTRNKQYHCEERYRYNHPYHKDSRALFTEHIIIAFQVYNDYDPGKDVGHVAPDFFRKLHSLAAVGLLNEVFPSPAVFIGAE